VGISDLNNSFSNLTVVVWDENRLVKDIPLGKVTLSRKVLMQSQGAGSEQWMPLAGAETEGTVTGDLHVEISYYPATPQVPKHTFSVNSEFFSFFFFFSSLPLLELVTQPPTPQSWLRASWSPEMLAEPRTLTS